MRSLDMCTGCTYSLWAGNSYPCIECDNGDKFTAVNHYDTKQPEVTLNRFDLDKLIQDHWEYVEATLKQHDTSTRDIEIAKYHYITSAKHFWKHCEEHYNVSVRGNK